MGPVFKATPGALLPDKTSPASREEHFQHTSLPPAGTWWPLGSSHEVRDRSQPRLCSAPPGGSRVSHTVLTFKAATHARRAMDKKVITNGLYSGN